jgi:hypothetical protein
MTRVGPSIFKTKSVYLKGDFIMDAKLELEVERILEMGIEYLKNFGVPSSSAYFISPKGMFAVDPFDFEDKRKSKKILKKLAIKHKATMVTTLTSALISKIEGSLSGPLYFNRNVIFSYGETKTDRFGICQEFEFDKNGQIVFGNKIYFPVGSGSMTGFMCSEYS